MSSGFISESDLAERRRVRQELWKKQRNENDPEEPPEEPIITDHRSLYERLQEQKQKKQEEYEEAHKLKNMVRGLEDDEVDFLDFVDDTKLQEEKRIKEEEKSVLVDYRKRVLEMQQKAAESEVLAELKLSDVKKSSRGPAKKSQLTLIAGTIKRKKDEEETNSAKKIKDECIDAVPTIDEISRGEILDSSVVSEHKNASSFNCMKSQSLECVAILPGLGVYTDSSESDNSSDSEVEPQITDFIPRDITGRIIKITATIDG